MCTCTLCSNFYIFQLQPIPESMQPSLTAVNGLVSLVSGDPLLKLSDRLSAFWCNMLPSIRARFLFMSAAHKCNVFSIITKHSHTLFHNFCSLRCDSKTITRFSFLLHNFLDRRFVFTVVLSNLSIWFFSFLLIRELLPFHFREALYSFSLVYPSCCITSLVLWDHYEVK